jgi:hypothetical protein
MLSWSILPGLAVLLSSLSLLPSTYASAFDFTLRALEKRTSSSTSGWTSETCATVAGTYCGYKYNFGCLSLSDVSDFCDGNKINSYIESLLNYYVSPPPHDSRGL